MPSDFVILNHERELGRIGLHDLASVRQIQGMLVKNHRGRRDILRIEIPGIGKNSGLVLFLKRNFKAYRKNGLKSIWKNRQVRSESRIECENSQKLAAAGIRTAEVVAYGEECGRLWERFSFILTRKADGDESLDEWIQHGQTLGDLRSTSMALAKIVKKMHSRNLASADLFARHIFIDHTTNGPQFTLIDMARLDQVLMMTDRRRARDLAALNLSIPLKDLSTRRRLEFLLEYAGSRQAARKILVQIGKRIHRLRNRGKFKAYFESAR